MLVDDHTRKISGVFAEPTITPEICHTKSPKQFVPVGCDQRMLEDDHTRQISGVIGERSSLVPGSRLGNLGCDRRSQLGVLCLAITPE